MSSDEISIPYIFVGECDIFVQSVNWSTPVEYILIITRYRHDEIYYMYVTIVTPGVPYSGKFSFLILYIICLFQSDFEFACVIIIKSIIYGVLICPQGNSILRG